MCPVRVYTLVVLFGSLRMSRPLCFRLHLSAAGNRALWVIMSEAPLGPTGEICYDLPSPYLPDARTGLLHLPRFVAKIRKDLKGELPPSYQRNYCRGFDRYLCLHLGIDPQQVIDAVREAGDDEEGLGRRLAAIFPEDLQVSKWNRQLVQIGMSPMGQQALAEVKKTMSLENRDDLRSFADMIEVDEGRLE